MKGYQLIDALTEKFREHGNAGSTIVVKTDGAYTMTVDRVESKGGITEIHLKRLVHKTKR